MESMCIADENPLIQISIPQYVAERVWTEGKELALQDSNICISPGCTDESAWLVKSDNTAHQRPYFVECKKSGQMCCEKSCIMFNSCGVCAHIVAVATRKKCFETFVNWLRKRGSMNITKMAHSGLPKGAGKKAHSHRKFSTKSSSRNVKKILQDADSESFTPRPGITTKPDGSLCNRRTGVQSPVASYSETDFHLSSDPVLYSLPIQQPPLPASPLAPPHDPPIVPPLTSPVASPHGPPVAPPPAPPPLFSNIQACVDTTRFMHGSPSLFTAASQDSLYSQQSSETSSLLPAPPPLVRAPVQVSMPFMYAPMYLPCPAQQT